MKRKKPSCNDLLSSCEKIGPEDGLDPRLVSQKRREKPDNRKALQLCSEVAKALSHALAWELGDDLLGSLLVESVVPAPNSARLLVTVSAPPPITERIEARLRQTTGRLRTEVAAAIHRRRVPDLTFQVRFRDEP